MTTDTRAALAQALDALEEIALAGMSGTGQESPEAMAEWHAQQAWRFIGIAARSLAPIKAALAAPQGEAVLYVNTMYLAGRRKEADLNGQMLEVVTRTAPVFIDDTPLYTTDQLRAYGAACAAAEREACANLLDLIAADYGTKHLMFEQNAADYCAGAIRARKDAA